MTIAFRSSSAPRASVVVLGYRDGPALRDALAALAAHGSEVAFETVVVLNGASTDVREVVAREIGGVRVVDSAVNLGFGGGCNRGAAAAAASAEYLVFLNDDAVVERGWLDALVATADLRPEAGAVGSKHVGADGLIAEAGQVVWSDGSTAAVGAGHEADDPAFDYVREVDYCSAASLLVRRSAWEQVGGFDDRYFPAYFEDVDLCFALGERGWRVVYEPRSRIRHDAGGVRDRDYALFLYRRNHPCFVDRWRTQLGEQVPRSPAAGCVRRAIHRARGDPPRLLLIVDNLLPRSPRANERMLGAVEELSATYAIAVCTCDPPHVSHRDLLQTLGVELVADPEQHMRTPEVLYDVVLVSRSAALPSELRLVRELQPQAALVYDFVSAAHRRAKLHAESAGLETEVCSLADRVTCATREEAERLERLPAACPADVADPAPGGGALTWEAVLRRARAGRQRDYAA